MSEEKLNQILNNQISIMLWEDKRIEEYNFFQDRIKKTRLLLKPKETQKNYKESIEDNFALKQTGVNNGN